MLLAALKRRFHLGRQLVRRLGRGTAALIARCGGQSSEGKQQRQNNLHGMTPKRVAYTGTVRRWPTAAGGIMLANRRELMGQGEVKRVSGRRNTNRIKH